MNSIKDLFDEENSCISVMPCMIPFAIYLCERFGSPIASGRNRVVWKTNNGNVVKVPRCEAGCIDNSHEASVSMPDSPMDDEDYTNTKIMMVNDYCVAVSEYVEPLSYKELEEHYGKRSVPDWILSIDCGQVGFNKKGKLKAFDYGLY